MGQFITPDVLPTDTFCRQLLIPNDPKWIGAVSGALLPMMHASEWVSFGGLDPEEVAARCVIMLNEFWESNGCGGDMACCEDQVILHRFDPETGRPQVSKDGGETWTSDPQDPENLTPLLPPIVGGGGGSTKCDAATNASEHVNELITATAENLTTAATVLELAIAVAEALLALMLIIFTAGTLTAPVTAVATAIWAAATGVFSLGIAGYNAYWTTDKQDAILCMLFCAIGEDGQFSEAQYQAFRSKIYETLPASPALDIIMTAINAGGARGLSQMASYGNAAEADCASCDCGECHIEIFVNFGGTAEFIGMSDDSCLFLFNVTDPDPSTAGRYTMNWQFDAGRTICNTWTVLSDESVPHSGIAALNCVGGGAGLPLPFNMTAASLYSDGGVPFTFIAGFRTI